MEIREAVIVDAVRSPIGKRNGSLSGWHPADLLGHVLTALVERSGVDPEIVDDVVGGCVTQVGEQSTNVTRNAWVGAGLPWHVPATSVDRQCGSSQQAAHFVAQGVMAGAYDVAVACGVESMTRVPLASNAKGGKGPFSAAFMSVIDDQLKTQFEVAQILADQWKISREDMDAFSLESHRRAARSTAGGLSAQEIVAVPEKDEEGRPTGAVLDADEGIRQDTSMEKLGALPSAASWDPSLAPDITAGNSSQMSDGAAAMLIASRQAADRLGLRVRARLLHFAVAAEDPILVLSAPNPATRKLLLRSNMTIGDFDAMECNEAFAAIALMWAREFLPDQAGPGSGPEDLDRLNPRGGAIAIGHPLGASGVRIMTTLLNQLESIGGRYGLQTMCEGGGQANATVIERLP
jgi:acetyl-CoA acetyltransferase family protein